MRNLWFVLFVLGIGVGFAPSQASARNIYLNGKLINGIANQKFVNVTVRIDEKGDVHITGRQYKVSYKKPTTARKTPTSPQPGTTARPTARPTPSAPSTTGSTDTPARRKPALTPRPNQKYVMVAQRNVVHGSGYRVTVYINGRKVRTILTQLPQDVLDVTPYLKKGNNRIELEAIKMKSGASGTFTLFLAQGSIGSGQVKVQEPYLLNYKRTDKEQKSYRHIYNIDIK